MRLQGKNIATLVAEGVEDLEYYVPLMRLQEEGEQVLTAALELKTIHGKNGLEIKPDTRIDELNASDLYALIVPGGWAPDKLRRHEAVKELVRQMNDQEKVIGIICHGGLIAISAEIVKAAAPRARWGSRTISSTHVGPGRMSRLFVTGISSGAGWWPISPMFAGSWSRH